MEAVVDYFGQMPSAHRSAVLVGGIVLFWVLESVIPLFLFRYHKWKHAGINLVFTFTTIVINFAMAFVLVGASKFASDHQFGVLQWFSGMPLWLSVVVGLLLMDLISAWLAHFTEHKVKWMWKFHLIHHTDTFVDTTTANRHHPGESVIRFLFTTLAVLVTGAPFWLILMYQSLSVVLSQFNHANIALPARLDSLMSWLIVTPGMHHVHHHFVQPYTDTNYGNIFSIWDRLFGTFAKMDGKDLIYGIDTHPTPEDHSRLGQLMKIPFEKYRSPKS